MWLGKLCLLIHGLGVVFAGNHFLLAHSAHVFSEDLKSTSSVVIPQYMLRELAGVGGFLFG